MNRHDELLLHMQKKVALEKGPFMGRRHWIPLQPTGSDGLCLTPPAHVKIQRLIHHHHGRAATHAGG